MNNLWNRIPVHFRQTLLELAELVGSGLLTYLASAIDGKTSITAAAITAIVVKTTLKFLRANPYSPLPDYVNDQK